MRPCHQRLHGSGVATVTNPAPLRNAVLAAITAAPDFPTDPATTSTCPYFPLCPSSFRISGIPANSSGPPSATSLSQLLHQRFGRPNPAHNQFPATARLPRNQLPNFGRSECHRQMRVQHGPSAFSPSDGSPDGVSTATIHAGFTAVA
jgi:hypothetical protein